MVGDDRWRATLHGLQGRYAKGFRYRGHDIDVRVLQTLIDLVAAHESREVESVRDAPFCREIDHLVHHVSRSRHAESDVARAMEHQAGRLDEIFRSLLHGDASEKRHDLLLAPMVGPWQGRHLRLERIDRVVDREDLARVLVILVDDRLPRQFAHAHDAVGVVHAVLLYRIDRGVDLSARPVEVGGVDVYAERLSAHRYDGVVVDLLVEVGRVSACKLHGSQFVDVHVAEVGIDMVAQPVVVVGRHQSAEPLLHEAIVHVAPYDRHAVHGHDPAVGLVLVAKGMRQTERDIDVALRVESLRDAEVGRRQSAIYVGRILPSKH